MGDLRSNVARGRQIERERIDRVIERAGGAEKVKVRKMTKKERKRYARIRADRMAVDSHLSGNDRYYRKRQPHDLAARDRDLL